MFSYIQLSSTIHVFSSPNKCLGAEMGCRMTIIQLPDNQLWVHSPIQVNQSMLNIIQTLGEVRYIVAPNLFHYQHLTHFMLHFPKATVYGPRGLATKIMGLKYEVLDEASPCPLWAPYITSVYIHGMPNVQEFVFFHPDSKLLIVTDLVFHFRQLHGWPKLFWTLYGVYGRLTTSWLYRSLISDKDSFRGSITRILEWNFEHIIMPHGKIIMGNGRDMLEHALKWCLVTKTQVVKELWHRSITAPLKDRVLKFKR